MEEKPKEFEEGLWYVAENDIITVGVTEEALNELDLIQNFLLMDEGDQIEAGHMIGELNNPEESIALSSPVSGELIEINESIMDNPKLVYEDPLGDSWLFKVQCDDEEELEALNEEKEEVEL